MESFNLKDVDFSEDVPEEEYTEAENDAELAEELEETAEEPEIA